MTRTITIEPGPDTTITGTAPPFTLPSWWPWAVAALAIGGLWYLTRDEREEGSRGPKGDAG